MIIIKDSFIIGVSIWFQIIGVSLVAIGHTFKIISHGVLWIGEYFVDKSFKMQDLY